MTDIMKMNENDMEQVNGGNFFTDMETILKIIIKEPVKPMISSIPSIPTTPAPVVGRGKC